MAAKDKQRVNAKARASMSPEAHGRLFGESTRKSGLDADWNQVHPDVLHRIIWAIDLLGGATTFSTTRSGNAYVVKVYLGEPQAPKYFDGDAEGRDALAAWADSVVEAAAGAA